MNEAALILLAGGASSRMGTPKGLLPYGELFWIEEQIQRFSNVGERVYIGLGFDSELYFQKLPQLKESLTTAIHYCGCSLRSVINPLPHLGSFYTLQAVLKEIANDEQSFFINPIDVPLPNEALLKEMLTHTSHKVAIPVFKEKKGHPVLIDSVFAENLKSIDIKDPNARLDNLIRALPSGEKAFVESDFEEVILNLNERQKYDNYRLGKL
jgi:molybdopterin-guanine dinucleotide biosynthesis protein A